MLPIPYPPTGRIQALGYDRIKSIWYSEVISFGVGKLIGPQVKNCMNGVNEYVSDYSSGIISEGITTTVKEYMEIDDLWRVFLTNDAVARYNQILRKGETNLIIHGYSYAEETDLSIYKRFYLNLIENAKRSAISVARQAIPVVGTTLGKAVDLEDTKFPIIFKEGDVIALRVVNYVTLEEFDQFKNGGALVSRNMFLVSLERDKKIFQAYIVFFTEESIYNPRNKKLYNLDSRMEIWGAEFKF